MGSKGTNTTTTTSQPPQAVLNQYQNLIGAANQAAAQPLSQYSGPTVAGFTPQQQQSFNEVQGAQGVADPYINSAAQLEGVGGSGVSLNGGLSGGQIGSVLGSGVSGIGQSTDNIQNAANMAGNTTGYLNSAQSAANYNPANVSQFMDPYLNSAVAATQAEQNNQDAQQQAGLQGNLISQGAYGGDRSAVAQGILGGQQALANNATIAGMENTGYQQAQTAQQNYANLGAQTGLGAANANTSAANALTGAGSAGVNAASGLIGLGENQQQQELGANEASGWLAENAGNSMANLGSEALNTQLTGANAELQSGALQQQLNQEELNVPYQQFQQQQAYPFQTLNWLSGISTGLGGSSGGTSSTTTPGANTTSQVLGLATAAAGAAPYLAALQKGGRAHRDAGGYISPTLPQVLNGNYAIFPGANSSPTVTRGMSIPTAPTPTQSPIPAQNFSTGESLGKAGAGAYKLYNNNNTTNTTSATPGLTDAVMFQEPETSTPSTDSVVDSGNGVSSGTVDMSGMMPDMGAVGSETLGADSVIGSLGDGELADVVSFFQRGGRLARATGGLGARVVGGAGDEAPGNNDDQQNIVIPQSGLGQPSPSLGSQISGLGASIASSANSPGTFDATTLSGGRGGLGLPNAQSATTASDYANVNNTYNTLLGRNADVSGLSMYGNQLNYGLGQPYVNEEILNSPEYQKDNASQNYTYSVNPTSGFLSPQLKSENYTPSGMFDSSGNVNTNSMSNYASPPAQQIAGMGNQISYPELQGLYTPPATTTQNTATGGAALSEDPSAVNAWRGGVPGKGGGLHKHHATHKNDVKIPGTRSRRDDGGVLGDNLALSSQNGSPQQNMNSQYSRMSPEQLQELAVRMPGNPQILQELQQKRMGFDDGGDVPVNPDASVGMPGAVRPQGLDPIGDWISNIPSNVYNYLATPVAAKKGGFSLNYHKDSPPQATQTAGPSSSTEANQYQSDTPPPVTVSGLSAPPDVDLRAPDVNLAADESPKVDLDAMNITAKVPPVRGMAAPTPAPAQQSGQAPTPAPAKAPFTLPVSDYTSGWDDQPHAHIDELKAADQGRAQGLTSNKWFPLIQAGLAMAAGRSPNALTNIATGLQAGLAGVQTQAQQESQNAKDAQALAEKNDNIKMKNQDADMAARNMAIQLNKIKNADALTTQQETDRQEAAARAQQQQQFQNTIAAHQDQRAGAAENRAEQDWEQPNVTTPVKDVNGAAWRYNNDDNVYEAFDPNKNTWAAQPGKIPTLPQPVAKPTPDTNRYQNLYDANHQQTGVFDKKSGRTYGPGEKIPPDQLADIPGITWTPQGWAAPGPNKNLTLIKATNQ